jgi:hypothetical protein
MKKVIVAPVALACLLAMGRAQTTQPPAVPPKPPQMETGPDVDLLHHLRRSTVSLGLRRGEAGKQHFVTVGSAVIVALDEHHACLLTAKHVLFNPDKGYTPTTLFLRVPQSEPRAGDDLGVPLPLIENGRMLWRGADDADLAVAAVPNLSAYSDLHGIRISDFGGEDDLYQGASVIVFGYPELLGPDYQITPIARGGIVAWTNPNGRFDHTFLVDANVFSGNSGGPVFHTSGGLTRGGAFAIGGAPRLIGIVSKDAYEEAPVHAGPAPANSLNPLTGEVTPITAQVLNIGGIGVVEPISKAKRLVVDFLDPLHAITP